LSIVIPGSLARFGFKWTLQLNSSRWLLGLFTPPLRGNPRRTRST